MSEQQVRRAVLIERYVGDPSAPRLAELAAANRSAARSAALHRVRVAYLGSALIPDEQTCFCVYASDSVDAVEHVGRTARAPTLRIVEGLLIGRLFTHHTDPLKSQVRA